MNLSNLEALIRNGWRLEVNFDLRVYGTKFHAELRSGPDTSYHHLGDTVEQALTSLDRMVANRRNRELRE